MHTGAFSETSKRTPEANTEGELRVCSSEFKQANSNMTILFFEVDVSAADDVDVEKVAENVENDEKVVKLVEYIQDGNKIDLEESEDNFTVEDNARRSCVNCRGKHR